MVAKTVLNEVTFKLVEDERGRFVVDIRYSRDGGKPVQGGVYTSYETIDGAIECALRYAGKFLKPREYIEDELELDESGTTEGE